MHRTSGTALSLILFSLCAFAAGVTNGLLGTGGGILLLYLLKASSKKKDRPGSAKNASDAEVGKSAYAAVVLCVLPLSVLSLLCYIDGGMLEKVPPSAMLPYLLGALPGGILGAVLLDRMSLRRIEWLFAALVLFAGVRMLF